MTAPREDSARPAGPSARPHRLVRLDDGVTLMDVALVVVLVAIAVTVVVAPPAGVLGVDGRHFALLMLALAVLTPKEPR